MRRYLRDIKIFGDTEREIRNVHADCKHRRILFKKSLLQWKIYQKNQYVLRKLSWKLQSIWARQVHQSMAIAMRKMLLAPSLRINDRSMLRAHVFRIACLQKRVSKKGISSLLRLIFPAGSFIDFAPFSRFFTLNFPFFGF